MAIHPTETIEDVSIHLLEKIQHMLENPSNRLDSPLITRVEVPIPEIALMAWLRRQRHPQKMYWSDREGIFETAGIGTASVLTSQSEDNPASLFTTMRSHLDSDCPHHRYYGGFRFNTVDPIDPNWQSFGAYTFLMPLIEAGRNGEDYYLACHIHPNEFQQVETFSAKVSTLLTNLCADPSNENEFDTTIAVNRTDSPDQTDWESSVNTLLDCFGKDPLEKVVLARKSLFSFNEPVDPVILLHRLKNNTSYSYHYCFQLDDHTAFIGASPERLYKQSNHTLESEALAGTRPRNENQQHDDELGQALLTSEKDIREQQFVLTHIEDIFQDHCSDIQKDPLPHLLKLRHCQHLLSRISGSTTHSESDGELLQELHPTPAVGGVPTVDALEHISRLEPFDRGWYAAPVGWVAKDASEFAVAIRSALIHRKTVSAYSGAGIVPGSDPREEWNEIESKIADFQHIVTQP